MDCVIILHEALISIHHKNSDLLFKFDFIEAHDKIKWPFVYLMFQLKGFPDKWCVIGLCTLLEDGMLVR